MKFIHTADIHLDSPLRGLSAYSDAPAERLRTATRDAFDNLVTRAIEEEVDFMVIAGDVYDGDWKDFNTGLFFVRQMGRLRQAGIRVYLLYGNHDAESEMTRRLELPDNVHVFPSNKAASHRIEELKVVLHGRSFKVAATTENLAASYPAPVPGWLNIGVLHTALEGHVAHPNYAPCSVPELEAKGYQYWALGHVHEHRVWQRGTTIAYPGNLQGRHIRELGARGALLVTVQEGDVTAVERLEVDVLRWHLLEVDLAGEGGLAGAVRAAGRAMDRLLGELSAQLPLAMRVVFSGASAAHGQMVRQQTQVRQEVLAQAVSLDADRLWIEKVLVTTRPLAGRGSGSDGMDALAELHALAAQAADDPDFIAAMGADFQQLLDRLPRDVLEAMPELDSLREGNLQPLARDAVPLMIALVEQGG